MFLRTTSVFLLVISLWACGGATAKTTNGSIARPGEQNSILPTENNILPTENNILPAEIVTGWAADYHQIGMGGPRIVVTHLEYQKNANTIVLQTQVTERGVAEQPNTSTPILSKYVQRTLAVALESLTFADLKESYDKGIAAADVEYVDITIKTPTKTKIIKCGPYDELPDGIQFLYSVSLSQNFSQENTSK